MSDDTDEPESAQDWLDMLEDAGQYFRDWQDRADRIDEIYAGYKWLTGLDHQESFALFWANMQVMLPSIYARPPDPVVTPRFKDRRPIYRVASEFLERNCVTSVAAGCLNETMLQIRDDLAILGRGVGWVRYSDEGGDRECVHYEHVDRQDFRHSPARRWSDVTWVARRCWMTKLEMADRFGREVAQAVNYETRPKTGGDTTFGAYDMRKQCGVWEIWNKPTKEVVWIVEGYDKVLDKGGVHLEIDGFFPCPEPAYGTVQRQTLLPVPDIMQYKPQLEEINSLTRRIHALGEALRLKGFYTGSGEIGDAVEAAYNMVDDAKILVPVSASAMLTTQQGGDPIVWLPLEMIANTIMQCVQLRQQLMTDVYELIGMSDIQRGMTQAEETLGAQRIKQQNNALRVREKQNALVRIARDMIRIGAEIMAEKFERETLELAAQMDLPTDADVRKQIKDMEAASKEELENLAEQAEQMAQQAMQSGEQVDLAQMQQAEQQFMAQQQQLVDQWGRRIADASQQVTIDQVIEFLRDEKLRPYVLDIETDSTVYPDELAEKAARAEFLNAFNGAMGTFAQAAAMGPEALALAGSVVKFSLAPYRVGRELEGQIDDLVDQAPQIAERMAAAQGGESEEMTRAMVEANQKLAEAEIGKAQAQMAKVQADVQKSQQDLQFKAQEVQVKSQQDAQRFQLEIATTQGNMQEQGARIQKIEADIQLALAKLGIEEQREAREDIKTAADIIGRQEDRAISQQQASQSNARADRGEERADRQQSFSERTQE